MTIAPRLPDNANTLRAAPPPAGLRSPDGEREITRRNTYAVRVRGHRMRQYNLFDGDVIVLRRHQRGPHREIASATINQREVALRELSISRLGVRLCPEDQTLPTVFLHNGDIQVLGMVMGVEAPRPARRH
ncbi:LexA family protein [Vreelandella malpeensis]|uniref:LexA family protein n=1 Tax=Vreelandella malpeensis TaxID=1172368 RepID=UPI001D0BDB73|nr:S24 family peptidase [Halomonas malpeensis]